MLGVHGNGLTHLIWMPATPRSAVIEMFFVGGFARDCESGFTGRPDQRTSPMFESKSRVTARLPPVPTCTPTASAFVCDYALTLQTNGRLTPLESAISGLTTIPPSPRRTSPTWRTRKASRGSR
jgi:hypothetical protein